MGKIVKYCAGCEESFAEKFAFCPNCGQAMTAFEMNPVATDFNTASEAIAESSAEKPSITEADLSEPLDATPKNEPAAASVATNHSNLNEAREFGGDPDDDFELELFDDAEPEYFDSETNNSEFIADKTATFVPVAAAVSANGSGNGKSYQTTNHDFQTASHDFQTAIRQPTDGAFHVTVIEEKNVRQRNLLLLGALVLMMVMSIGGVIYSIFNHPLLIGAIGDEGSLYALIPEVDPVPPEIEETPKQNPDKGGGGGGGGRDEKTPTSQGRLATQTEKPLIAPDKSIVQLSNPSIPIIASTQGNVKRPPTTDPYGDPNSKYTLGSNGMGTGGGQGSGVGTGQGSGRGTGQGSGLGSGSGSGEGTGNGGGKGGGDNGDAPPPPPKEPVGVTEGIKIIAKPKANYTDAARTNQIQGTVRLRVTFSASGAIGSITPVSGLSYGLTEQAIAAARQIRFEPAKRNGVPQTVTKIVEYGFTIY